jgi:hypothetical protein
MAERVLRLAREEAADRLAPGSVAFRRQIQGTESCAAWLEDTAFRLAEHRDRIEALLAAGRWDGVAPTALALAEFAAERDLPRLRTVARDLAAAGQHGDPVATAAIGARLVRLVSDTLDALVPLVE